MKDVQRLAIKNLQHWFCISQNYWGNPR